MGMTSSPRRCCGGRWAQRAGPGSRWRSTAMTAGLASFVPPRPGRYEYMIEAWSDEFATWRRDYLRKAEAKTATDIDALEGANLLSVTVIDSSDEQAVIDGAREHFLSTGSAEQLIGDAVAAHHGQRHPNREDATRSAICHWSRIGPFARAGAWYEIFPRSQGKVPGRHGTFDDCIARVPEIAALGFDVLYLTPIHPIGRSQPQGPQQRTEGRRKTIRAVPMRSALRTAGMMPCIPELGTLADFRRPGRRMPPARHGDRARFRNPVLAGSSLDQTASGMVQATAGRLDPLCGKPAEEIRGHRQSGFLRRRCGSAMECIARRHLCSGSIKACTSSASTIRTPSRFRSGNG